MRFKIDWASLIVGSKFTVFASFYFVCEGIFQVQAPGGHIWRGDLAEGFLCHRFGGLTLGAYFRNFTVYVQCTTSRVDTSVCLRISCTFTYALTSLKCLCLKSSIADRFISTVVTIQYYDNPCRNAMIITSSPHIVHVVSMLDVPSRFGSTSFQSKDVKGAQKSEFLFCVNKNKYKMYTHTVDKCKKLQCTAMVFA